jgi:hypothetical protein
MVVHILTLALLLLAPILCCQAPSAVPQPHKPINTIAAAVEELVTAVSRERHKACRASAYK